MIAGLPAEEGAPNFGSSVRAIAWERVTLRTDKLDGEHFFGLAHVAGERRFVSNELRRHLLALDMRVLFKQRMTGVLPWVSPYEIEKQLNCR
ncbi:MAG: hypothetical protein KDA35_09235, partial [Hyphomonadaceae bacterium]|nr:hypothetical protein [Hyphomonadaceae bacterium]